NFGIKGAGPLLQLICLRRLLDSGIRPDVLFVEVIPAVLNQPGEHPLEEEWLAGGRLTLAEIAAYHRFHSQPVRLVRHWLKSRWAPCSTHRKGLRDYLFSEEPENTENWHDPEPGEQDEFGWQPFFVHGIAPDRQLYFEDIARKQYKTALGEFQLSRYSATSLRTILAICREQAIPVRLVLMPEGTAFQQLY